MAQMAEKFLLSRLARTACLLLLALCVSSFLMSGWLPALASATAAAVIWTTPAVRSAHQHTPWRHINAALVILLAAELCASLWLGPAGLTYWLFAMPLAAFAVLPLALAAVITLACLGAVAVSDLAAQVGPDRHQLIASVFLATTLSLVLVFMREYKNRQLAPLRRTDELTQAASRDYLSADLHKEIQRSEREGTDMAVAMIGLDTHLSTRDPDEDIRAILPRIGRFLHSQLRDFDTYYRVADLQFLIILPGNTTAEAAARAAGIRRGLGALLTSHDLDLTVSAGVAGLNIGDTADTLQQSVANALRRAQRQGGNRVQSYSAWADQHNAGTGSGAVGVQRHD